MKDILLAIDENEQRATEIAETVKHLFDTDAVAAHIFHDFVENPEGASVQQVAAVKRATEILEDAGVEVDYHERSGDPADSIVNVADELDADAIVIAGRKRSPAGKALFGSVSQSVMLDTDRPVIMCGGRD